MSYVYEQRSGRLLKDGAFIAMGGSGHGDGFNNPELESQENIGPIPKGRYIIGGAIKHGKLGPCVMRLIACAETNTYGRTGFCIHGIGVEGWRESSEGCILLTRPIRENIARGVWDGDDQLEVV